MENATQLEGFSSKKTKEEQPAAKKQLDFQPLCIEDYDWTIEKDAELGYRPRFDHIEGPMPFVFLSHSQPFVTKMMEEFGETCVYKAKRPKNSFEVHLNNFKSGSMYEVLDPSFKLLTDKTVQNIILNPKKDGYSKRNSAESPRCSSKVVQEPSNVTKYLEESNPSTELPFEFDADFENGNLDLVFKVSNNEFNLLTRCDTNSRGHNQGFHFKIKANCEKEVKLNIINLVKPKTLFSWGSFPYIGIKDKEGKFLWQQLDQSCKIAYIRTNQKYQINPDVQKKRIYMTLSFSIKMGVGQERWLAYSIPYNYSDLLGYLNRLSSNHLVFQPSKSNQADVLPGVKPRKEVLFFRKWESPFIRWESLCKSESLLEVPLLTITDFTPSENCPTEISQRPIVYIVSRVHPSESVASYSMEGFINRLLDGSAINSALLKLLVFKIVPMINPDGVIVGNFRTNLTGEDLNRRYDTPSKAFHPTVV
jgi:hypothetical protein